MTVSPDVKQMEGHGEWAVLRVEAGVFAIGRHGRQVFKTKEEAEEVKEEHCVKDDSVVVKLEEQ